MSGMAGLSSSAPSLPEWGSPSSLNRPTSSAWQENSGLARPERSDNEDYVWHISDGPTNGLMAQSLIDGSDAGTFTFTSLSSTDWEDAASATVGGQPFLYIADVGDNSSARSTVQIIRTKEPAIYTPPAVTTYPFGDELIRYPMDNSLVNSGTGSTTYDTSLGGDAAYSTNVPKNGTHTTIFDGSGGFVDTKFGNGRNPSSAPFSVSFWARRDGSGGGADQHVFGTSASPASTRCYIRYSSSANAWAFRVQGAAQVSTTIAATLNTWFHICLVMDGTTARIYVNGVARGTAAYTSYTLPSNLYFGNLWENGAASATEGFDGQVDELAIYARALSAGEVADIANLGSVGSTPGGALAAGTNYEAITCEYPAGNLPSHKDCETLLVDPANGDMYLITKRITPAKLYRLAHASSYTGTQTLEYMGTIWTPPQTNDLDATTAGYINGGDIDPDNEFIVLRGYEDVYLFARPAGMSVYDALQATGEAITAYVGQGDHPSQEPKGEAVCVLSDRRLVTTSEYLSGHGSGTGYPTFVYPLT